MKEVLVCDACMMKIPTVVHAQAHYITHGEGHAARVATLDDMNREVQREQ